MPSMARHEGVWEGIYRHVDLDGVLLDTHRVTVRCELPDDGPYPYIQHNHFVWEDGREHRATLPGILRDGRLWWDVETFHGYSWETLDGILMLNLTRKDEAGANFFEMITLGSTGEHRSRTWQWFRDGKLYKRTLCDERLVSRS
ncbi:hypothetical protein FMM06_14810 [Glacieibacterium frigidum]|uniref:DUF3598 domain-containing protein n=2 Tax=Glacieibacterium frigidum TaxID=2593303 RepID=A0A552UAU7_9SPHN|nr:hypothetical protein FMM06_14810 [Glacieibacterium frigidum]